MTLYKYVIADRVDILENGLVRFTHPSALNDLAELRPAFDRIFTSKYAANALDIDRIIRGAYENSSKSLPQTFESFQAFALSVLASEDGRAEFGKALGAVNSLANDLRSTIYKSLDQAVGVLSLSETWDNAPMWAHYADQHRGFVIGFEDSNEYFYRQRSNKDEFYHLRKVVYDDVPPGIRSFSGGCGAGSVCTATFLGRCCRDGGATLCCQDGGDIVVTRCGCVCTGPLCSSACGTKTDVSVNCFLVPAS